MRKPVSRAGTRLTGLTANPPPSEQAQRSLAVPFLLAPLRDLSHRLPSHRLPRHSAVVAGIAAAGLALAACSSSSGGSSRSSAPPAAGSTSASASASSNKPVNIAYLSFAVENSYDAPMLAAAQTVASDQNATLKVFDAQNNPQTQYSQLQDVINSGQYNGFIVQPIFGTGLTQLVAQAITKGIKVVNMDQILGPNLGTDQPQVTGL